MAHKYPNILIHCIFSTKQRRPIIPPILLPQVFRYLVGIGKNINVPVVIAGGTTNHVHLLFVLPSDMTVAKAVQTFKANSSRWIGEHGVAFSWQEGYGAFSVSGASNRDAVRKYIKHQEEHHAKRTFEEEFLALLQKCGLECDRQKVFA